MQLFPHLNLCQGKALWALGFGVLGNIAPDSSLVQVVVLGPLHFEPEKDQLLLPPITAGFRSQPIDPIHWGASVNPTERIKGGEFTHLPPDIRWLPHLHQDAGGTRTKRGFPGFVPGHLD